MAWHARGTLRERHSRAQQEQGTRAGAQAVILASRSRAYRPRPGGTAVGS